MECEHQDRSMIDIIKNKILKAIEILYYINSPARKMLKDMGIYDGDIDYIVEIIGEDPREWHTALSFQYHKILHPV